MAGYAMVEAMRAMNVEKVALNGAYHGPVSTGPLAKGAAAALLLWRRRAFANDQ